MRIDPKFISLLVLLSLLGFGGGYYLKSRPAPEYQPENPDLVIPLDARCDLNQADCETNLPGVGAIIFSIQPRPIMGVSPLQFRVQTQGLVLRHAVLELSGVDMNMGLTRLAMHADETGRYVADGSLSVCVRDQMQWRAELWLDTRSRGLIKVPYIFTAAKY